MGHRGRRDIPGNSHFGSWVRRGEGSKSWPFDAWGSAAAAQERLGHLRSAAAAQQLHSETWRTTVKPVRIAHDPMGHELATASTTVAQPSMHMPDLFLSSLHRPGWNGVSIVITKRCARRHPTQEVGLGPVRSCRSSDPHLGPEVARGGVGDCETHATNQHDLPDRSRTTRHRHPAQ